MKCCVVLIEVALSCSKSVELCRSLQAAGASFITVHGRTVSQRAEPVNVAAIREIAASLSIPVVANGGVKCANDVQTFVKSTNARGLYYSIFIYLRRFLI